MLMSVFSVAATADFKSGVGTGVGVAVGVGVGVGVGGMKATQS